MTHFFFLQYMKKCNHFFRNNVILCSMSLCRRCLRSMSIKYDTSCSDFWMYTLHCLFMVLSFCYSFTTELLAHFQQSVTVPVEQLLPRPCFFCHSLNIWISLQPVALTSPFSHLNSSALKNLLIYFTFGYFSNQPGIKSKSLSFPLNSLEMAPGSRPFHLHRRRRRSW